MTKLSTYSIKSHFESVSKFISPQSNFIEYCNDNMFFITLMPKDMLHTQALLQNYKIFHIALVKKIFGRNYSRKQKYQPFTYAFIDFAGSRQKTYVDSRVRKEHPHIHALMLSHPNHSDEIFDIISNENYIRNNPALSFCSSNDFQRFDSELGNLDDLISYCTKGIKKSTNPFDFDEWNIFSGKLFEK